MKKLSRIAIVLSLLPVLAAAIPGAQAAPLAQYQTITFDAITAGSVTGTTLTIQHTASGDDRYALVSLGGLSSITDPSVTYAGVSMTLLNSHITHAVFGLVNPPSGEQDVVLSWEVSQVVTASVVTYANVNQVNPVSLSSSVTHTAQTKTFDITVSTNPNDMVFLSVFSRVASGEWILSSDATYLGLTVASLTNLYTYEKMATTSSTKLSFSSDEATNALKRLIAIVLQPAPVIPTSTPTLTNTPEPTATATWAPVILPTLNAEEFTLSSGQTFHVERRATFGEVGVMLSLLCISVPFGALFFVNYLNRKR